MGEYIEEFYRLCARNNLKESDNQLISHFIGGLYESLRDKLSLKFVWFLSQIVNFAFKAKQ